MQTRMRHLPSLQNRRGQTMGQAITIKRAIKVKFEWPRQFPIQARLWNQTYVERKLIWAGRRIHLILNHSQECRKRRILEFITLHITRILELRRTYCQPQTHHWHFVRGDLSIEGAKEMKRYHQIRHVRHKIHIIHNKVNPIMLAFRLKLSITSQMIFDRLSRPDFCLARFMEYQQRQNNSRIGDTFSWISGFSWGFVKTPAWVWQYATQAKRQNN